MGRRIRSEYFLIETQADGGRAYRLLKVTPGSDPEAVSYDGFLPEQPGYHPACRCKGFVRHDGCKHLEALKAIAGNRWFPDQLQPAVSAPDLCPLCRKQPPGIGSSLYEECGREMLEEWRAEQTAKATGRDQVAECPECGGDCVIECRNAPRLPRCERPHNNGIAPWM